MAVAALAPIAIGASVLSGVIGTAGALMQGKAASDMYNYRAGMAEQQATYARQAGDVAAQAVGFKGGALMGAQKAAQAASGLDVFGKSAQDVGESTGKMVRLDELTTRHNAEIKAVTLGNEAALDRTAAKASMTEGYLGAAKSILGSVTSTSDKWLSFRRAGAFA